MKTFNVVAYAITMVMAFPASAHTTAESNIVVRSALSRALTFCPHVLYDGLELPDGVEVPDTWRGFLGGDTNGWTLAEKRAAFDWYLTTLGTNDCMSLSAESREGIMAAIAKCDEFKHTNAVPAMKALVLNPRGVYRQDAMQFVFKFSSVSDTTTAFVETIMTNSTEYAIGERGTASCQYANKLLSFNATNESQRTVVTNGVAMFYKNRMLAPNAFSIIDDLFVRYIDDYAMSSNRLEHALNALSLPDCGPVTKRKFTSVTNQLLSSGQPLPWINVGGGGN